MQNFNNETDVYDIRYFDNPLPDLHSKVYGAVAVKPLEPDVIQEKECFTRKLPIQMTCRKKTVSSLQSANNQGRKTIRVDVRKKQPPIQPKPEQVIQPNLDMKPAPTVYASTVIEAEVQLADVKAMSGPADNSVQLDLPEEAVGECKSVLPSLASPSIIINERYIRLPEVLKIVSISRSSFYDRMKIDGPRYDQYIARPIKKGRTSLWKLSEVMAWMNREGV